MKIHTTPGSTAVIDPQSDALSSGVAPMSDDQKKLKRLIERRHPEYQSMFPHWEFLEATYEGGREWFADGNIFRYVKEGDSEYRERLARCYRFNHSREVVDLLNKYLFKQHIVRNEDDAPESVKNFWKVATKNGLGIRDFSRQVSKKSSVSGRIAVVVDSNMRTAAVNKAEEKAMNARVFAYALGPEQLLDYAYDEEGNLEWILVQECTRDDNDPIESTGDELIRFRLWTKNDWRLFEERKGRGLKKTVVQVDARTHNLGVVPVILVDNMITDEEYSAPSLIDDIAYLDRAVANYLSNLDAIIQDQTFSQLAMPAQNVLPGEDNYNKLLEMGTKRIFLYDGEGGAAPHYLSPDPKQAQLILAVINKIINEIYHTVGLAGERTKQDNALGIDNSSGVAKAYDFERVNALLQAKADSLEVFENKLARLVALWNQDTIKEDVVSYPDNFDTRGLYDEFDIAARLMLITAPDSVRQHQMKTVIDKLFPQLAKELREKMIKDLESWPIDPVQLAADMAAATAPDQQALQNAEDRQVAKATLEQK